MYTTPPSPTFNRFRIPFAVVELLEVVVGFPNGLNSYTKLCVAVTLFGVLLVFFCTISADYEYFPIC